MINKADTILPHKRSNLMTGNTNEITTQHNCNCEKYREEQLQVFRRACVGGLDLMGSPRKAPEGSASEVDS